MTWLAAMWMAVLIIAEYLVAEGHPAAALMTYFPQEPFVLPIILAVLTNIWVGQRKDVLVSFGLVVLFVFLFLGFHISLPKNDRADFRVMTINIAGSEFGVTGLVDTVIRENPDILMLQEAKPNYGKEDALKAIVDYGDTHGIRWYVEHAADVAILSRYPLTNVRDRLLIYGMNRRMIRADADINGRGVTVACVHLATNVWGASNSKLWKYLCGSAAARLTQARSITSTLPATCTLVAGDCNLPPRGTAFGMIANRYPDSFQSASGFGYTFPARMPIMRIDHVFASPDLVPLRWRSVNTGSSDHLAVVVDFVFRK